MEQSRTNDLLLDFKGTYNHAIDPKGRIKLPSSFREHFSAGGVFALALDNRNIAVYTAAGWRSLLEWMRGLPRGDARAQQVRRAITGSAFDFALDRQGRTLVPPQLRSAAAIGREITLVGADDKVEIWDRARWADYFRQSLESLEANSQDLTRGQ